MAGSTTFGLERGVFEYEWPTFIAVALDARCVGADTEFGLFRLETAMSIVTAAAVHCPF